MAERDGGRVEVTEPAMRAVADRLRASAPRDVSIWPASPHKATPAMRDFPFTHLMVFENPEWEGLRAYCVTLVEDEDGYIARPDTLEYS